MAQRNSSSGLYKHIYEMKNDLLAGILNFSRDVRREISIFHLAPPTENILIWSRVIDHVLKIVLSFSRNAFGVRV